jgi:branched-chain amino acid aminotransferase
MLEGISRRTVIEMAAALGLTVEQRDLPADQLRAADEVFITTSGGGVLPVTQVDAALIGNGQPGPTTRRLIRTYWDWHRLPQFSQPIDYGT